MADLNSMDAEIKRIKEVTSKQQELLAVEKKVNEAMLYSSGVRKKYTDALSAAADMQKELIRKENEHEKSIVANSAALIANMKYNKKLKLENAKLLKVKDELAKSGKTESDQYQKVIKDLKNYETSIKNSEDAISSYEKAMEGSIKSVTELMDTTKDLKKAFDDLSKVDDTKVSSQEELNDLTKKRIALMRAQFDIQEKAGVLSANESKDLKDKLNRVEEMHKIQGDLIKRGVSDDLSPMVDDLTKSAGELTNKKKFKKDPTKELGRARGQAEYKAGFSLKKEQMDSLRSIFSGKTGLKEKLGAAKSYGAAGKGLEDLDSVMKTTGKTAMGTGAMFKMLGSAMGSLGKLGWIGLIIQAVATIAKAVNELDKFIKGFNQTFAKLQGPTVMMGDVRKSMKQFSSSIFDLQRNLKYGLKSEEITGMFQSISESGMNLQGILQRVSGGYSEVIEKAAKVHLDFGVSMEEAGAMLGEQMTDLKSTVDEASDSFKVLSYDASIAGIQSQKFYQATYAAAEGLSYYGKFLNSASTTLKDFQKQGGMGFKDAQQQTQNMTNLFKNMDDNSRVAFMEMSGGVEAYRKDFIKLEQDSKEAIGKHLKSLGAKRAELTEAKKKGDKEAVKRIEDQIKAEEDQLTTAQKTLAMAGSAAKSNAQDMAMYLEMISDKAGEKLGDYFKALSKDQGVNVFTTETRAMVEHMKAVTGVSREFAMQMIGTIKTSRIGIEQMAKDMQGLVDILPNTKTESTFRKDMQKIISDSITEDGKMNMYKIKKGLEQYSKDFNIDTSQIYGYMEKFPNALQEFFKVGFDGIKNSYEKLTLDEQKGTQKIYETGADESNKRLTDLVKGTHTIGDIMGIQEEYLKHFAATSAPQELLADAAMTTAMTVGNIFDYMTTRWGKQGREEAKAKKIEGLLYQSKKLTVEQAKTDDKDKKELLEKQKQKMEFQAKALAKGNQSLYTKADIMAGEKVAKEIADTEAISAQKDYKARSGGYALLSKGDVVVNAKNMSSGVGGDLGAFAGTAASDLIRSMPSAFSGAAPQIPVNISIGSVSGDPEQFLNRIKPAIEQAFERMYYDKQKRR